MESDTIYSRDPIYSRIYSRGFTLLEMLVVLIIVGLAAGLLFEGSAQVMGMQSRLEGQLVQLRGTSMRADWLRQLVEGLQPDYQDGKNIFKGSARGFSGLSTNPLSGDYAGLEPFALVLAFDQAHGGVALRYGDSPDAPVLMSWQAGRAVLRYWDNQGVAHEDWPPPLGLWPQLPFGIRVESGPVDAPWLIAAAPYGPTWPVPRPRDVMGGVM